MNEIDSKIIYPGHRLTTGILSYDRRFQNRDLKAICPDREAAVLLIHLRCYISYEMLL
jgi:hypothetical protein